MLSTNSRQSTAPRTRKLPMLLLIETWSAACCWFSNCTDCSMVMPDSERRCSIQFKGRTSAGPRPCKRRASSATKALTIGGLERAMSAMTRIRLFGSVSTVSIIRSAQMLARFRSTRPTERRTATRRKFSMTARRSMIGVAHNSPSLSGETIW